jgi:hypothetical protein
MFAKITNGSVDKFPYSVGDLRRDNPNTSFPRNIPTETMAEYGMVGVIQRPTPEYNATTHFVEYGPVPVLEDGWWVLLPTVRELSAEQLSERYTSAASSIRGERFRFLAETDWTALSDVTMSPEMATYRQALRDITLQPGFPHNVLWPTKPSA